VLTEADFERSGRVHYVWLNVLGDPLSPVHLRVDTAVRWYARHRHKIAPHRLCAADRGRWGFKAWYGGPLEPWELRELHRELKVHDFPLRQRALLYDNSAKNWRPMWLARLDKEVA
jgi:hypothetical protein